MLQWQNVHTLQYHTLGVTLHPNSTWVSRRDTTDLADAALAAAASGCLPKLTEDSVEAVVYWSVWWIARASTASALSLREDAGSSLLSDLGREHTEVAWRMEGCALMRWCLVLLYLGMDDVKDLRTVDRNILIVYLFDGCVGHHIMQFLDWLNHIRSVISNIYVCSTFSYLNLANIGFYYYSLSKKLITKWITAQLASCSVKRGAW